MITHPSSPSDGLSGGPGPRLSAGADLPAQATQFIGRIQEIEEIRKLLDRTRLLTLTGAGGSGKTRLALEVASEARELFPDGVLWVEFAPLDDPELVAEHVRGRLGIRDERGRSPAEAALDHLRDRAALLVLDNCEHLIGACAEFAASLMRTAPRMRILATSREALAVSGELAWLLPPLSLPPSSDPSSEAISASEAVQLFLDRARAVSPSFGLTPENAPPVAQICRRLDGIPLAIELAATRVRVLTPEQILGRLDDVFGLLSSGSRTALARHRTLRATIDWSYSLLSERERQLLERFTVFPGDFGLEAAEALGADGEIRPGEVLDLLTCLVDKSLVGVRERRNAARYYLLESVRQYGRERLQARDELTRLRARHTAFYADLIAAAEPHFLTARRRHWVEQVQTEMANVRQALTASRDEDPGLHLRLVGHLCWFWFSSSDWAEGRRWLEDALRTPAAEEPTAARAVALFAAGCLATLQGQSSVARPWLEESLSLARTWGDLRLEAYSQVYLGMALAADAQASGLAPTEAALSLFRASGDPNGIRLALLVRSAIELRQGSVRSAITSAEEALEAARIVDQPRELGISLHCLGMAVLDEGDLPRAAGLLREAMSVFVRDPFQLFMARSLELLAIIAARRGQALDAARLFGAAEIAREKIGARPFRTDLDRWAPYLLELQRTAGEAAFATAWAEGRTWSLERATAFVLQHPEPAGTASVPDPAPPPDLRVLALGPLQVFRDGDLIPLDAWGFAKPRELLVYLLCHPDGRTRQQIAAALWPSTPSSQVRNSFHVVLHHLRRALGQPDSVRFEGGCYRISPGWACEFDVGVFETTIAGARGALSAASAVDRLRAGLALYRGDFLAEETAGEWHREIGDRLRRMYVEGALALGEALEADGRCGDAADAYRMAVARDDACEGAYRGLMRCLDRLGERPQAIRLYERLVALLDEELGSEPELETAALADALRTRGSALAFAEEAPGRT